MERSRYKVYTLGEKKGGKITYVDYNVIWNMVGRRLLVLRLHDNLNKLSSHDVNYFCIY